MMRKFITGILLFSIIVSMMAVLPGQVHAATPTTSLSISGPEYATSPTYVNSLTKFSLTSSESGSTWYWWNSEEPTPYTGPFGPSIIHQTPGAPALPEDLTGPNTLYYNSSDDSGNHETPKSLDVFVDDYAPTTAINFDVSITDQGITYLNITSRISLSSSDAGSGLKHIYYKIDQNAPVTYTVPFTINTAASHTLSYYAEDNLGNLEAENTASLFVDTVGPQIQIEPGQPSTGGYVSSSTQISVMASDDASGVNNIYYRTDNGAWQFYSSPFNLQSEERHTIYSYAVDRIGNPGNIIEQELNVDNTPPEVSVTGAPGDTITVDRGDAIVLTASDSGVGNCTIQYSLDDGATWADYAGITAEQDMVITYYARDALGNSGTEQTLTVTINSSNNNMLYLGMGFTIAAIGIILLLYINRAEQDTQKKIPQEESEPKKKKSKKRKR